MTAKEEEEEEEEGNCCCYRYSMVWMKEEDGVNCGVGVGVKKGVDDNR